MVRLSDIQININTDFSHILNEYASLLEKAMDKEAVLNQSFIKKQVERLIELIASRDVKRLPYDSITAKVLAFSEKADDEEWTESFNYLINEITEVLKVIIDDFESKGIFAGKILNDRTEKTKYSKSIIAFYKLLEHTKLASLQYQTLYKKTKKEIGTIQSDIDKINNKANKVSTTLEEINNVKTSIYTDFIAILGVFSSFVFVMFGGFNALSSIIESIGRANISMAKVIFISSVLISFLITVLYSLIYWVSLIIDKKIVYETCNCEGSCKSLKHLCSKHRYFLTIIGICFVIAFIMAILIFTRVVD